MCISHSNTTRRPLSVIQCVYACIKFIFAYGQHLSIYFFLYFYFFQKGISDVILMGYFVLFYVLMIRSIMSTMYIFFLMLFEKFISYILNVCNCLLFTHYKNALLAETAPLLIFNYNFTWSIKSQHWEYLNKNSWTIFSWNYIGNSISEKLCYIRPNSDLIFLKIFYENVSQKFRQKLTKKCV